MKHWSPKIFFALSFFIAMGIAYNCFRMCNHLRWKKDLVATVEPAMYNFGYIMCATGYLIVLSLSFLFYNAFKQSTKLLKMSLACQVTTTFICLLIMGLVVYSRYPSLNTEEAVLKSAMSDYGKDDRMTEMMDTIQTEMKCCGVIGLTDWKNVNGTYLNETISYGHAYNAVINVPVTCVTDNETHMQFYDGGCLEPFFNYKEYAASIFFVNIILLAFFEMALLFFGISVIKIYYEKSNEVVDGVMLVDFEELAESECEEGEDVLPDLLKA